MQTRHRIAVTTAGLALVAGPALALAAPSGAAGATPSPSAPVRPTVIASTAPGAIRATLPVASATPGLVLTSPIANGTSAPPRSIQVPAGHVTVTRHDSDGTAVLVLCAVGALLLAGGTVVAIRRRS